jgi:hypothetical protein
MPLSFCAGRISRVTFRPWSTKITRRKATRSFIPAAATQPHSRDAPCSIVQPHTLPATPPHAQTLLPPKPTMRSAAARTAAVACVVLILVSAVHARSLGDPSTSGTAPAPPGQRRALARPRPAPARPAHPRPRACPHACLCGPQHSAPTARNGAGPRLGRPGGDEVACMLPLASRAAQPSINPRPPAALCPAARRLMASLRHLMQNACPPGCECPATSRLHPPCMDAPRAWRHACRAPPLHRRAPGAAPAAWHACTLLACWPGDAVCLCVASCVACSESRRVPAGGVG